MTVRRKLFIISLVAGIIGFSYAAWYRSDNLYRQFDTGVPDDAAYYLKPALNYTLGHGSSFDGVHPTNGYQPLWFMALVGYFSFLPLEKLSLFELWYLALLLQAFIFGGFCAVFMYGLIRFTKNLALSSLCLTLIILLLTPRIVNLLETPLQLLILAIIFVELIALFERPAYEDFRESLLILGLTVGALFLARTDGIVMLPALLLPLSIKFRRNLKRLIWFITPVLFTFGIYLLVNHLEFGVAMPVSGSIKMDTTRQLLAAYRGWDFLLQKLLFIFGPYDLGIPALKILIQFFACMPALYLIIKQVSRQILSNKELVLLGLSAFLCFKYFAYTIVYHGSRTSAYWYWISDVIVWVVIAATLMRWILERLTRERFEKLLGKTTATLCITTIILVISTQASFRARAIEKPIRDTSVLLDLAAFIRSHDYFTNKRIGSYNSGILGYFGGRALTNLDGLINSPEYAKLILAGKRDAYITDNFDVLVEYHGAYVNYYQGIGFSLYNVRKYIVNPVPYNEATADDYRVYIRHGQEKEFEKFLDNLRLTANS